jgi:hypothetical protein
MTDSTRPTENGMAEYLVHATASSSDYDSLDLKVPS